MGSWNRLSYPQRLFSWLLGYSILLVGGVVIFQYNREKEFKAKELDAQLQLINTYIISGIKEGDSVQEIRLDEIQPFDGLRVSIISEHGGLLYDNTLDTVPHTDHLDREEIRKALKQGSGYAVRRHSTSTGDSYFYSARKSPDGYIVRTAVPYSLSLSTLLRADYGFLWGIGTVAMIMCIFGYFATRRVGTHIMRLKDFAGKVENGAVISDVAPFPHDELGEISNNIVRLYARLQQANADRDSEHRAAQHEQEEKERIKKQLTNNINHELKTPVAAIQVCIETLLAHEDMSRDKQEMFLLRCLSNAGRLRRLLNDVATITRMDDGGSAIIKEPVVLTDIIRNVVADRQELASAKGIVIENDVTCRLEITGNTFLLESIFNNLIDNAIAYSGGTEITIHLIAADNDRIRLSFSDNGSGVPARHLPRLFERFYRIDKGRSRAEGGTGLGLAIVKNAVTLHGGDITVENLPDGGLMFLITFSVLS